MNPDFPSAVPEIPVDSLGAAASYYEQCLGFTRDWGAEGIGQVSRGSCRVFLTEQAFRRQYGSIGGPVVIWLNLNSKSEVDELHDAWNSQGARIVSRPESKPWNLHEFLAADPDGNLIRVFYDFTWERTDRTAK